MVEEGAIDRFAARRPPNGTVAHADDGVGRSAFDPLDVIGIGFGPSNLALAVCARETGAENLLFIERHPVFRWHPGMLIDGARMQISFLKDLVSLRNPASPYSFLQYVKARGRLERFVNLSEFRPTRVEYQDYLRWVAEDFAGQVRYGAAVTRVRPVTAPGAEALSLFEVETRDEQTGMRTVYYGRNVVYAGGGRARIPVACPETPAVIHSSEFLPRLPETFPDRDAEYDFVVVGGGQSAGEITAYLLAHYVNAKVHFVQPGYAPRPTDNSPFVNEQFMSGSSADFFGYPPEKRAELQAELSASNYGVIREDLLDQLYDTAYLDEVKGRQRLFLAASARLSRVDQNGDRLNVTIVDRFDATTRQIGCDGLVLATGYDRSLNPGIFGELEPMIVRDESDQIVLSREHRAELKEIRAGLYLQGYGEARFGLGDTLLSLLPFRSLQILRDIAARTPRRPARVRPLRGEYPPKRHIEIDEDKLYQVVDRFKFATMISTGALGEPVVTQLPLILDRSRGSRGVLFGHMDRANPHVELIDGSNALVLFHGPNSYISPWDYETDQLPTWNSVTVHLRGRVAVLADQAAVVRGLCAIAARSEHDSVLRPDDPRIDRLIGHIVGFEIEITELTGRFKLSQDRTETDRHNAALAMARRTEAGEREFIEYAVGLPLISDDDPRPFLNDILHHRTMGDVS